MAIYGVTERCCMRSAVFFLGLLFSAGAFADWTAIGLANVCSGKTYDGEVKEGYDQLGIGLCNAYVQGFEAGRISEFANAYVDFATGTNKQKAEQLQNVRNEVGLYCLPEEITLRQIIAIFLKHVEQNPERWHQSAGLEFGNAMRKAFPCGSKNWNG